MTSYKNHLILTGCTIRQALIQLTQLGINAIIFVVDEENKLIGSITDGDIRRGLIKGALLDDPINTIIRAIPRFIKKGERDIQKVIQLTTDSS